MKIKEMITVIASNAYLNIESEKGGGDRIYEGKVIFIRFDLLERKVKLVDIINEFLL